TDLETAVLAVDENISRAVIRRGRLRHLESARHAHHDITRARLERVANEAAPLRPPRIFHFRFQVASEQAGDFVLKTFEPLIGEREVGRDSTDAQLPSRSGLAPAGAGRESHYDDQKHQTREANP